MPADGQFRSKNPRWSRQTGRICALALHRATRGLRSQRQHASAAELWGAERGLCPHGATAQAEHRTEEDAQGLKEAPGPICETRLSRRVGAMLPKGTGQPRRARVGCLQRVPRARRDPIASAKIPDRRRTRCAAEHCWWRRFLPGWHRTALYAFKPNPRCGVATITCWRSSAL